LNGGEDRRGIVRIARREDERDEDEGRGTEEDRSVCLKKARLFAARFFRSHDGLLSDNISGQKSAMTAKEIAARSIEVM